MKKNAKWLLPLAALLAYATGAGTLQGFLASIGVALGPSTERVVEFSDK